MQLAYIFLFGAIVSEIAGTVALKLSHGMSRIVPSFFVVFSYSIAFWLAALSLKVLPLSIVAAIWEGFCIIGLSLIGVTVFGEKFGWVDLIGIALILSGTFFLTMLSS
ncbi:MAG: multidrug efflux SMR transporter [Ectothiorhodospiraceae bacterium]|nr:multidrug efflux SMR transporter [Ectothiorhodospiraceae bacterium]